MVGILHAIDVHRYISILEAQMPSRLELLTVWYGCGQRADDVYRELKAFRADCPGTWFHLNPKPASVVISKLLFGDDDDAEPGITLQHADDAV